MKIDGIAIKGWRSFDEVGAILNNLKKVNLIIGPNNVGKSNISRLLRKLKEITASDIEYERRQRPSDFLKHIDSTFQSTNFIRDDDMWRWLANEITMEVWPTQEILPWPRGNYFSDQCDMNQRLSLQVKINKSKGKTEFSICGNGQEITIKPINHLVTHHFAQEEPVNQYFYEAKSFKDKFFVDLIDSLVFIDPIRHYSRPHKPSENAQPSDVPKFYFNGADLMAELINLHRQDVKNWSAYKKQMEKWLKDIIADSICNISLADPDQYRLHFKLDEDEMGLDEGEIIQNLDELGTGVAQVIMLLSFLYLNKEKNLNVFMDEPESNLHATAVAKLVHIFTTELPNHNFFIATHSHALLDQVSENWSIYRTTNKPHGATTFISCNSVVQHYKLLDDLGIRASQILQTNMVIWVEGPSDAIYLAKWIKDSSNNKLISGTHYSFLFYGGSNLSSHTLLDDEETTLIDMLKTSRYAAIVCDSDCNSKAAFTKQNFKTRVKNLIDRLEKINDEDSEIKDFIGIWVTDGREIENYVPPDIFKHILLAPPFRKDSIKGDDGLHHKLEIRSEDIKFGKFDSFDMAFASAYKEKDGNTVSKSTVQKIKEKYSQNKVNIAKAVVNKWKPDHYEQADLSERIQSLVNLIKKANEMTR